MRSILIALFLVLPNLLLGQDSILRRNFIRIDLNCLTLTVEKMQIFVDSIEVYYLNCKNPNDSCDDLSLHTYFKSNNKGEITKSYHYWNNILTDSLSHYGKNGEIIPVINIGDIEPYVGDKMKFDCYGRPVEIKIYKKLKDKKGRVTYKLTNWHKYIYVLDLDYNKIFENIVNRKKE